MRLIDADKLHYIRKWFGDSDKSEVVVFAKEIDKAPTVDAVQVIRCKECKYWEMEKYIGGEGMACQFMPCDGNVNITEPTDFCCWAERKEE